MPMIPALTALVAVLLLAAPLAAHAQPARKIAKIGVLSPAAGRNDPDAAQVSEAFEQALQGLGWAKDQNLRIEERYAAGRQEALAPLAAELVALDVDVLVAWTAAGALAAKQATRTIPTVFLSSGDPIAVGLVPNLAHPGGNITGVSGVAALEEYAKRLGRIALKGKLWGAQVGAGGGFVLFIVIMFLVDPFAGQRPPGLKKWEGGARLGSLLNTIAEKRAAGETDEQVEIVEGKRVQIEGFKPSVRSYAGRTWSEVIQRVCESHNCLKATSTAGPSRLRLDITDQFKECRASNGTVFYVCRDDSC